MKTKDTLFEAIKRAGIEHSNHHSDLRFPVNDNTRAILRQFPDKQKITTKFTHSVTGKQWFDTPFAFLPWWNRTVVIRYDDKRGLPICIRRGDRLWMSNDKDMPVIERTIHLGSADFELELYNAGLDIGTIHSLAGNQLAKVYEIARKLTDHHNHNEI